MTSFLLEYSEQQHLDLENLHRGLITPSIRSSLAVCTSKTRPWLELFAAGVSSKPEEHSLSTFLEGDMRGVQCPLRSFASLRTYRVTCTPGYCRRFTYRGSTSIVGLLASASTIVRAIINARLFQLLGQQKAAFYGVTTLALSEMFLVHSKYCW